MRRLTGCLAVVLLLCAIQPVIALADGITSDNSGVSATAADSGSKPSGGKAGATSSSIRDRAPSESSLSARDGRGADERAAAREAEIELQQQISAYMKSLDSWQTCLSQTPPGGLSPSCPQPGSPPFRTTLPAMLGAGSASASAAAQVTLTPEQVAYIAFARLHLDALKPVIGPPPEINRWKMAAVGYPLWLSGGGDPNPPAVSDEVYNLRVRLKAHVTNIDFLMGDGNVVRCQGSGLRWTPAVEPGEKSPICGYQYSNPSLPDGSYTVTARTHWDVDWTINNQTGVIQMIQTSSVELPVGELQTLVR
jgi:hypothetical protein